MAECLPLDQVQKQVQLNLGNDLGEASSLPTDLVNFLGGNATEEQTDTPHHLVPSTACPPQLLCENGHQFSPTHTRGYQPRPAVRPTVTVGAEPQSRRMPDLTDQADDWIQVKMRQKGSHPLWWKELRALYWDCLLGNLYDVHTLQSAQWKATAFKLPLAQEEASRWWEAPCSLSTLHHWDFLPQVDSPGSRDFCITSKGKP